MEICSKALLKDLPLTHIVSYSAFALACFLKYISDLQDACRKETLDFKT